MKIIFIYLCRNYHRNIRWCYCFQQEWKMRTTPIRIPKFWITVIPEAWPSSELAFIPLKDSAAMSQSWLLMAWLTQRTHLLLLDLSQEILDILFGIYIYRKWKLSKQDMNLPENKFKSRVPQSSLPLEIRTASFPVSPTNTSMM